jgi:hypothetical protein
LIGSIRKKVKYAPVALVPEQLGGPVVSAYQSAMLELDDSKLPLRIAEARRSIYDRAEKVLTASAESERRELMEALHALNILEKVATKQKPAA